jgi:hypothetical protein
LDRKKIHDRQKGSQADDDRAQQHPGRVTLHLDLYRFQRCSGAARAMSQYATSRDRPRSTYSALSWCGARRAWGRKACSGGWLTEPQPRAAINLYRNWRAVESEASSGTLTTAGLAAVHFDSRRSDTRSRRDRRLLRPPPLAVQMRPALHSARDNHRGG